jgi:hypothetical protein
VADQAETGELVDALRALERWGAERDWLGPDPYEGLNATRVPLLRRTPLGRRLLMQLVKRSPVDLRPLLGIRVRDNATAIAHVASGYARATFLPPEERRAKLTRALERLEAMRLDAYDEPCWSYPFDVETRVFFYPATMPNTIATAFAAMALIDGYDDTRDPHLLELATGAGDFFLRHVPQVETPDGAYFGYFVGDRSPIHNASMMICGLLARLLSVTRDERFRAPAQRGVAYCLAHQRPDGSWPYAERPNTRWVDGFHSGYVIDALIRCAQAGLDARIDAAVERALTFYERELLLADGTPKYYAHAVYPIDGQSAAQAIQTFALAAAALGRSPEPAWRVLRFSLRRLRRRDGAFLFQRRRLWANPVPHVRWVEAPMFEAMTHLLAVSGV